MIPRHALAPASKLDLEFGWFPFVSGLGEKPMAELASFKAFRREASANGTNRLSDAAYFPFPGVAEPLRCKAPPAASSPWETKNQARAKPETSLLARLGSRSWPYYKERQSVPPKFQRRARRLVVLMIPTFADEWDANVGIEPLGLADAPETLAMLSLWHPACLLLQETWY